MLFNNPLMNVSDLPDNKASEQIKSYLTTLNNQLQYIMMNIGEENLSETLSSSISEAYKNAQKINWLISDGTAPYDFSLTDYSADQIATQMKLKGFVEVSDLSKAGAVSINGANITQGTVSPDKLPSDENGSVDLSSDGNGLRIGRELILSSNGNDCGLTATEEGLLLFGTGSGNAKFSLALEENSQTYRLNVLNSQGEIIGGFDI